MVHLNIIVQHIKVQQFLNGASTMLNNVFKLSLSDSTKVNLYVY